MYLSFLRSSTSNASAALRFLFFWGLASSLDVVEVEEVEEVQGEVEEKAETGNIGIASDPMWRSMLHQSFPIDNFTFRAFRLYVQLATRGGF